MIKKKLSILLSLSLVALFTSLLGTTSFGVTTEFIEEYVTHINDEIGNTNTQHLVNEFSSTRWQLFKTKYGTDIPYDNFLMLSLTNSSGTGFRLLLWNNSENLYGYYNYGSGRLAFASNGSITVKNIYVPYNASSVSSLTDSTSDLTNVPNYQNMNIDRYVFYIGDNYVYTDSTLTTISTLNWLYDNNYSNDYFTFLLNSNLNTITINGDSVPYIEHNTNQASTYVLGELGLAENFYNAELFTYRWQQGSWKLQNIRTLENIGPTTSNLIEVTIRGDWINPNTLYSLQMNPDPDSEFAPYSQPFFVKNRYTSITNGALDLDNTFSGDYYNNYNNDTNTEEIINNTNDMSNVDNTLNEFISGDASDIANKFGFVMFSQEYYDFIYNTIVDIVGVLEETGDVYFDYSMHGENPTRIYSSSFTTPNGTLKNFITMFLISCTVFAFYKYIADILELISTGNILEALSEFKVDRNIFKM